MAVLPSSEVVLESMGSDDVPVVEELGALVAGMVVVVGLEEVVGAVELDELEDIELDVAGAPDEVVELEPWLDGAVVVFVTSPGVSVP